LGIRLVRGVGSNCSVVRKSAKALHLGGYIGCSEGTQGDLHVVQLIHSRATLAYSKSTSMLESSLQGRFT
jgi:hypothetical protein